MSGLFISFEGGEGSGKSTVIKKVKSVLENKGYDVVLTREPGGTDVSEKIREVILYNEITPLTEALLFAASRKEHIDKIVKPALDEGKIVLCDRFIHSSYVYQGIVQNVGIKKVKEINGLVLEDFFIDLVVLLDVDPTVGLTRIKENSREVNKIDGYDISFHEGVRNSYLKVINDEKNKIIVDANLSESDVFEATITGVLKQLNKER